MTAMNFEEIKGLDERHVIQSYARFPVAIARGQGATLYDEAGKAYIDFSSGIGVCSVGHAHPQWVGAVADQAAKLGHISNLFYTEPYARLSERLCTRSGMAAVFFANSGAEANEGLIKLARKYSFDKYGPGRGTILTLNNSFHGRTAATLAATGQASFHNFFFPFPDGFRHADPTMESLQAAAGHDVCAVLIELVQGEGGVLPLEREFVTRLAARCAERDWLLLVDEVQTGIGRTGSFFAFQQFGIEPDAVSIAKGIGGGLPIGGFLVNERCRRVIGAGQHGSTFGGSPICAAAALAVLEILGDGVIAAVLEKGAYLRAEIEKMQSPYVAGTRGMGLMIGVALRGVSNKEMVARLVEQGLLCLTAGSDALRLLPPLTISAEEMDAGLDILRGVLCAKEEQV